MSKFQRWALVIISGMGYTAIISSTYIVSMQYALFQAATGFTNTQMGLIGSVVGIIALFGYLFGGVLSDFFKTKSLMLVSHIAASVLLIAMSTFPGFKAVLGIESGLAIFAIFTYWSPMAKFVSSLGPLEEEGRRYGFFFAAAAITGTLLGVIGSLFAGKYNGVVAMRLVYYLYAALNILVAVSIILFYKPQAGETMESEDDKFQLKYAIQVVKMPAIWLIGILGFAGYITGKVISYSAPFMQGVFSASLPTVTMINAIGSYGIAVFMSPIAGFITDKVNSGTKVMLWMLISFAGCMMVYLAMPWKQALFPIVVVIVLIVSGLDAVGQTNWFTPLSEIDIPKQVKGTAIGIVSVIMFSSDAFAYTVFGNWVDKYGERGFYYVFGSICIAVIIGAIATVILRKKYLSKNRGL